MEAVVGGHFFAIKHLPEKNIYSLFRFHSIDLFENMGYNNCVLKSEVL